MTNHPIFIIEAQYILRFAREDLLDNFITSNGYYSVYMLDELKLDNISYDKYSVNTYDLVREQIEEVMREYSV